MTAIAMPYTLTIPRRTGTRTLPDTAALRTITVATTALLLALLPPTVLALAIDPRTLNGARLWLKPMHFELALAINFITLALLLPLLPETWRTSRVLRWPILAAGVSAVLEILWIGGEAAFGRGSHFNVATPLEAVLYPLAGIGSLFIALGSGVFGYALLRSPVQPGSAHLHRGAALGILLGSIVTVIVAGYMSSLQGHLVGGPQTDAFGLPFLGWATRGGDLRVPHFFATHAMQALPVAGLLADRMGMTRASWLMPVLAVLCFAAVFGLFAQALLGIPFISL
jgi:hypothetical protein